jgi:hypothetical protein
VQFGVEQLAGEFQRPAAQVREALHGALKAELLLLPRAPHPLLMLVLVFGPMLAGVGATWAMWRRAAREAQKAVPTPQPPP